MIIPTPQQIANALVTMTIRVARDGSICSDVQTHNNSYADVAAGLSAAKAEIERVFRQSERCPYYPRTPAEARQPIIRDAHAWTAEMQAKLDAEVEAIGLPSALDSHPSN